MPYDYQHERAAVFTEEGQLAFLKIRDKARYLLGIAGAFRVEELLSGLGGDSWLQLACIDRLVELGEIKPLREAGTIAAQSQVYVGDRPLPYYGNGKG